MGPGAGGNATFGEGGRKAYSAKNGVRIPQRRKRREDPAP